MKLATLMENTAASPEFACGHGLCFYIETKNRKILFDMGPDERFLENADKLGIDISRVDLAVLSHGHYDHGGGIQAFLRANSRAEIHVQKKVFGEFYSHDEGGGQRYIGLSPELRDHPRIVCHTGDYKLGAELQVFAGVTGRECYSPANDKLFASMNGHHVPDLFMHEQNLLIREGNHMILIAGCAHNGIVNIMEKARTYAPGGIDCVISGMHLRKAFAGETDRRTFCEKLAKRLMERETVYYTCHCTGQESYELLKENMGDRIQYLAAGSTLEV